MKNFNSMNENQKTTVMIGGVVFFLLSAITSFGFFINAMPGLIQLPIDIEQDIMLIITGLVGVMLLDGGVVFWLRLHLKGAQNAKQRNITSRIFWASLAGSIAASFTYIFLFANSLWVVSDSLRSIVGFAALIGVAFVTAFHFYSIIEFSKHNEDNRVAVKEAQRMDQAELAEDNALQHVDALVQQKVLEKMDDVSDGLADQIAERIIRRRLKTDLSRTYTPKRVSPSKTPQAQPTMGFQQPGEDVDSFLARISPEQRQDLALRLTKKHGNV